MSPNSARSVLEKIQQKTSVIAVFSKSKTRFGSGLEKLSRRKPATPRLSNCRRSRELSRFASLSTPGNSMHWCWSPSSTWHTSWTLVRPSRWRARCTRCFSCSGYLSGCTRGIPTPVDWRTTLNCHVTSSLLLWYVIVRRSQKQTHPGCLMFVSSLCAR